MNFFIRFLALCCVGIALLAQGDDADLLPSEDAFRFSAQLVGEEGIQARWEIAEGYYMYRDKMEFHLSGDGLVFSDPVYPTGHIKQDELFGTVEVYTHQFETLIPISDSGTGPITLLAKGQGCNEPVGVCYPPMEHRIAFQPTSRVQPIDEPSTPSLPVEQPDSTPSADMSALTGSQNPSFGSFDDASELRNLLAAGMDQPDFLDVDDAFRLKLTVLSEGRLTADFKIADGYYLYHDKIQFTQDGDAPVPRITLPQGVMKKDEYFGEVAVHQTDFSVPMTLRPDSSGQFSPVLKATYQGCAEGGICYSPVNKTFDLGILGMMPTAQADVSGSQEPVSQPPDGQSGSLSTGSETDTVQNELPALLPDALLPLLFGAFVAGLLLTFTPCVLPMIPILSSVIAGQGPHLTKLKGGMLALFYVLGTTVTYAAMGAIAGATGEQLQSYFQNAWAIGTLSGIFVVMSLSMFGLFDIQMPAFIQSSLQQRSGKLTGSIPLVFILGLVSALIIGACVSPILISFLSVAVTNADPVLGAQIMFAMAWGMGLPLIAVGFGAGYLIPKAGQWMDTIKHVFGIMLIAVAIYLLQSLPEVPVLFLWGSFLIILSVYLGVHSPLTEQQSGWYKLRKGVGIVVLVWGVFVLIGGFFGQRDLFRPIPVTLFSQSPGLSSGSINETTASLFVRVNSIQQLDQALIQATQSNKAVLIDYYADWCVDCVRMEKTTFLDKAVRQRLNERFVPLKVDVTNPNDPEGKALKKRYGVFGPPAVLFIDSEGKERKDLHFYGYKNPADFLAHLSRL